MTLDGAERDAWTMILYMIDSQGRARIAALATAAIGWRRTSVARVGAMPGRPSRETIFRILRGDDVSDVMLRALGDKLGLPRDFIIYVGTGDILRARAAAADDEDLAAWVADLMNDRPDTRRRRHDAAD